MNFTQSSDVEMVVQTVRDYVEKTLLPIEMQVEHEDRIPPAIIREMGALGFFGLPFGEEDGGIGLGFTGYTLAIEQLGRANTAHAMLLSASSGLTGGVLAAAGTPEQRERWLQPIASGEVLGAFALVEEQTTSDGRGLRTTATPTGTGYRLTGSKSWVLNGPDAGLYVVFARLAGDAKDEGTGVFVVERGTAGLSTGPTRQELGLHGLGICEVRLQDCEIPATNRLTANLPPGEADPGLALAATVLSRYGVTLGAIAVGGASRLLDSSMEFATQRKQFGQPVGAFGAVQNMLADCATDIFVAQQAVYRAAWEIEDGHAVPAHESMAKLFASEMFYRVADRAVQVHGGMGFMKELWIERGYRDSRMFRLLGITSEELRARIARELGAPQQ